jgi:hypothetical protein
MNDRHTSKPCCSTPLSASASPQASLSMELLQSRTAGSTMRHTTQALVSPRGTEMRSEWGKREVSVEAVKRYARWFGGPDQCKSSLGTLREERGDQRRDASPWPPGT